MSTSQGNQSKELKSAIDEDYSLQQKEKLLQFSKEPILQNFGDLPFGEIPETLKYDREMRMTTVSNGIRVCTERWNSPLAAVGVFIGAGSRNETLETSGAAHFLEHLHFKGTKRRSRHQLEREAENLGTQLNAYTSREHTLYHTLSFKQNLGKSIDLLADMLLHSNYDKYHVELEKDTIWQELEATNNDMMETLMENVYYNIFREHMMGQPILGDIDNIYSINRDMIIDFHTANYYGDNMVVVATGNVNHDEVVEHVEKHFHTLKKKSVKPRANSERPVYNPGLLFIRDDEMINSNVGVFYDAPSWKDKDFYSFLLMQRIFGSYNIERNASHLNDVKKQYNSMHAMVGDLPDVTRHECIYSPYSDCGIFGHYFFGNEVFTRQMNYCGVGLPTIYAHYLNEVEVIRARNKLYNELQGIQNCTDTMQQIGMQMLYLNRRVPRSEIAKRVAHIDAYHMKHLCNEWFYDAEPSFTNWGPIESVSQVGSYKYFKIHTLATVSNAHHALYT
ncbi:hypothetical protein FGO68_gene11189 [Halteria grandinella]|uniref:Insulinase family protein n=1 Tax=Halteria grandinella TaxID=5974 RepID=A0A8J8T3R4_HALGN|nr:hypothetical protein FGO68_gene11189 [Halteria grandinella]